MAQDLDKNKKKSSKSEDIQYLEDKLKAAMWLIKSINQRQKTIYK